MRLIALHCEHTRRMWKCYGAPVAKTKGKSRKGKAATRSSAPKIAKPAKAAKPAKPAKPAPAPPPPPAPAAPVVRDEFPAPRDVSRLLRYGERFGASKIDV